MTAMQPMKHGFIRAIMVISQQTYRARACAGWKSRSIPDSLQETIPLKSLLQSKIKWHYNYALATLYDPDMRDYLYLYEPATKKFNFALDTENPLRMWTNQDERMHDASLDWNITLPGSPSWLVPKFQTGGAYNYRKRDFQSRRFAYDKRDVSKLDLTQSVEELFIPPNINPYEIEVTETTRPTDSYNARRRLLPGMRCWI